MSTATIIGRLALAVVLSAAIGVEREVRHKRAGLRTNTLIGIGAAVAMLVSKYGFGDVLSPGHVVLDPSRVAAQIVSGIGFVGAGIIFVRRDSVHGLTTAAVTWLTAMVGMACGAGLVLLAVVATVGNLVVVVGLAQVERRLPSGATKHGLAIRCAPASVADVLEALGSAGCRIGAVRLSRHGDEATGDAEADLHVEVRGKVDPSGLVAMLSSLAPVRAVEVQLEGTDDADG